MSDSKSESSRSLSLPDWTFSRYVLVFGVLVQLCAGYFVNPHIVTWEVGLLALMAVFGEFKAVPISGYGDINVGEGFYFTAACLHGPLVGGLLSATVGFWHDRRRKKRPAVSLFNVGWSFATFGLVGAAHAALGWWAAGLTFFATAGTLQALGESVFLELPLKETFRHQSREVLLVAPAIAFVSAFSVLLLKISPWAIALLALPLELVSAYLKTRELHRQLEATHRALEIAQAELVASGRQAALGVMAAGISHEINNPLAAALTNVHLLKMLQKDPKLKPPMDLLEQSLARCQNIVERMLKYSRTPSAGMANCLPSEVMADALLFSGRSFEGSVVIVSPTMADLPMVGADPAELVQILSNLVNNAHDAGAQRIEISGRTEDGMVEILVTDNGEGIPSDFRSTIFEPFFTTKAVGSGTGLGLSVAQGLARGCSGNLVLLLSEPGKTVFRLSLPTSQTKL